MYTITPCVYMSHVHIVLHSVCRSIEVGYFFPVILSTMSMYSVNMHNFVITVLNTCLSLHNIYIYIYIIKFYNLSVSMDTLWFKIRVDMIYQLMCSYATNAVCSTCMEVNVFC